MTQFSGNRVAAAVLALSLPLAPLARAASDCVRPDDQQAFVIEGLKSELMVTALSCHSQDKYNAFMARYQKTVATEEHDLSAYFKRAYGRSATKAHDDYITNLANVQAQEATKAGTAYCDILPDMFDEVLSLHDSSELLDFAHSQAIVQPVAFSTCTDLPAKAKAVRVRRARHKA
jgi:hypothetical protein